MGLFGDENQRKGAAEASVSGPAPGGIGVNPFYCGLSALNIAVDQGPTVDLATCWRWRRHNIDASAVISAVNMAS